VNKLHFYAYPLVTLLAIAAAVVAHAETPTPDTTASQVWSQTKTVAQVQQERAEARRNGSIKVWSTSYNPLTAARSERTRDEVKAEVLAARDQDLDRTLYGEDSGSFFLARMQPVRETHRLLAQAPDAAQR